MSGNLPPDTARVLSDHERRLYELERRRLPGPETLPAWVIVTKEIYVSGTPIASFPWAVSFVPYCAFTEAPTFYFGYRSVAGAATGHASRITESGWTITNGLYTAALAQVSYAQTGATIVNITLEGEGLVYV